jgi:predicted ATPase
MKIRRVVIRGLKALAARDDTFGLEPGNTLASSVCLRGLNGSGKTTYLDAISAIWGMFRRWTQTGRASPFEGAMFNRATLVAVQLTELPGPEAGLWLVHGHEDVWETVPDRGDVAVAGMLALDGTRHHKSLRNREDPLYRFWDEQATKLEQPMSRHGMEPLPNMVFIGAEDRYIQRLRSNDLSALSPEAAFRFLARYAPSEEKAGHIENSMAALLAVDPERFNQIAGELQRVLPGLRLLNRADPRTRRPLVQLKSGAEVTLENLSAGERAAIIALFTVARWMTVGGVVLIDEPELHQHISLMRSNLAVLEQYVVHQMKGQLIVASHAPEVWDHFRVNKLIVGLDLPTEDTQR